MKTTGTTIVILLMLVAGACTQSAPDSRETVRAETTKPAINRAEEEASLRATDLAWSDAAKSGNVEATAGFMASDGATLPPNEPIAKGPAAVKNGWANLLGLKNIAIQWTPTIVQVADSGEIGYTSGAYTLAFTDPKGARVEDKGKYLEVWKKIDGKWKCYLDMYNSDVPVK